MPGGPARCRAMPMLGTFINAGAIFLGGILGIILKRQFAPKSQVALKGILAVLIVFVGLATCWDGLSTGGVGRFFKHLLIAVLAMMLGHLTGRLLRLQKGLNQLGQFAAKKLLEADAVKPPWSDGFVACSILYCLPPVAVFGSLLEGLNGHWQTLAIKAVMDGMATMAFIGIFGWSSMAAAVPVVAFQGSITLVARVLAPQLLNQTMTECLLVTTGLLVFCVSLIILEIRKVELADYLPSLLWAPVIAWTWK